MQVFSALTIQAVNSLSHRIQMTFNFIDLSKEIMMLHSEIKSVKKSALGTKINVCLNFFFNQNFSKVVSVLLLLVLTLLKYILVIHCCTIFANFSPLFIQQMRNRVWNHRSQSTFSYVGHRFCQQSSFIFFLIATKHTAGQKI